MKSAGSAPKPVVTPPLSGLAATMTILATGLGFSLSGVDRTILVTNIATVRQGLQLTRDTASFAASVAPLTMAAAVLGAGALGDLYGKKRMYVYGLLGTILFGLLAAAAPNGMILMAARAGIGVGCAFLLGLSLAIVNDAFAPERRNRAISLFLAASFAIAAPLPAISTWFAQQIGWRASFLVTPAIALIGVVITLRYVPESPRASRRMDVVGLILIAAALLGVVYGISQFAHHSTSDALVPILIGLVAAAGFVFRELHTPYPALDLRIFRSEPYSAAVIARCTWTFVTGGSAILFAFYLVTVRNESPQILGMLFIPVMALQTLAAIASERAAVRLGDRAVLVTGLAILLAGLLTMTLLGKHTSLLILFLAVALNAIGSAIVQTPQSTIMMANAPAGLGGTVSAINGALGQAGYAIGAALFAAVGTWLFFRDGTPKLAEMNITLGQARAAFEVAHDGRADTTHGAQIVNSELARKVVQGAEQSLLYTIHTLSLIMTVVPIVAIVAAFVLLPPRRPPS